MYYLQVFRKQAQNKIDVVFQHNVYWINMTFRICVIHVIKIRSGSLSCPTQTLPVSRLDDTAVTVPSSTKAGCRSNTTAIIYCFVNPIDSSARNQIKNIWFCCFVFHASVEVGWAIGRARWRNVVGVGRVGRLAST